MECFHRDRLVLVGAISDGRIQWPLAKKSGRKSLILCGDLVRAVRHESVQSIVFWWGISAQTVKAWRRSLGVDRDTAGTKKLLGTNSDNFSRPSHARLVSSYNKKHGIRPRPVHKDWTAVEDKLLGTDLDRVVAETLGRSTNAVRTRRLSLGILRRPKK